MDTSIILEEQELDEEMATGENGEIAALLITHLCNHVYPNKLGRVFDGRTTYEMKPGYPKKEPDVSFVAAERVPTRVRDVLKLAPDLAIEIVSPNDKQFEVEEKALEYLALGVKLVWIVRPVTKLVEVYEPGKKPVSFSGDDELEGQKVIPGFRLKVKSLFD